MEALQFLIQVQGSRCGFSPEMPVFVDRPEFVEEYGKDRLEREIIETALGAIHRKRRLQQILEMLQSCGIDDFQDGCGNPIASLGDASIDSKCIVVPLPWERISAALSKKYWLRARLSGATVSGKTLIVQLRTCPHEDVECPICKNTLQNAIVFSCGHGCCDICSTRINQCPQCRVPIVLRAPNYLLRELTDEVV